MSPVDTIKQKADQPMVLIPLSVVLTAVAVVGGGRVIPDSKSDDLHDELQSLGTDFKLIDQKFDNFIAIQSGLPQRVKSLEEQDIVHSGKLESLKETDSRLETRLDSMYDRWSSWPGEIGGVP